MWDRASFTPSARSMIAAAAGRSRAASCSCRFRVWVEIDHAVVVAQRVQQRGQQVGQRLPGAGACLDGEVSLMLDVRGDGARHRELAGTRLEAGHHIGRALGFREESLDVVRGHGDAILVTEAERLGQRRRLVARERAGLALGGRFARLSAHERVGEQRLKGPASARRERDEVAQHRRRQRLEAVEQAHEDGRRRLGVR